jgi:Bacterial lectin/Chitobiase/beta-hexosaminidase C-terminal domain/Fn3 associated
MTLILRSNSHSSSSARVRRHILMLIRRATLAVLGALLISVSLSAQTAILTQHYDASRTGQNTSETVLTPSNVNSTAFGKLFSLTVDGYVYAQPLYVPALAIPGKGTHNVLYVATEHDSLYAFDADNGTLLWQVSFLINGATTLSTADVGNTQDINPEMGITGTPTIDATTNTIYVVVNTKEAGNIIYRLHAMDNTTGAEKFGGPALMTASAPGTASDGNGTTVPFNGQWENQRPGLLLLNGFVYIGFASHGDNGPWHGWILAYNKTTLAQTGVWCTSPNGKGNGIWGAGSGLAADAAGSIYVSTGNGDDTVATPAPAPSTTIDYGDSIVRVGVTNGVPVPTDYFTPWNQASLDGSDEDLGSGGVLVLPDQTTGPFQHILIQSGKQGEVYLVNRDKMTSDGSHYCNGCTSDPEIIQSISSGAGLWSMPAYWNNQIYLWGNGGNLEAYSLTNGMLSKSPTSKSAESSGFPGSTPVVSSNGTTNGIVWAVESDAYTSSGPAILRAYNATNVSNLLYASNLTSGRDTLGPAVKFVVPVVTNGKVYVGAQKQVNVFGLLSDEPQAAAPAFSPAAGSYSAGVQVTVTSATPSASIFYTTDGSTPTSGSAFYAGPVTVTATTTFNAIATSTGFVQSAVSTAAYTIQDQTAPPDVSPAAGTYTSGQSVQLSDTSPTPTIYYTTNGTMPTHSSTKYTAAISVTSTTTITAIASSPGLNDSPAVTATFTINPNATTINFGMGFATPTGMQFNGSTDLDDSRLQLTNGGETEAGSAFFTTPMNIASFTTDFTFQLSDAMADGITFTIQNSPAGATALGPTGGGLGYGPDAPGGTPGISNSVAVKYDLYSNAGEGDDSTGLYTNGASPTVPATDMTASGVILNNGDTMAVHISYNGTTLTMTITDSSVNATLTTSWPINIPQTIGGNTAFVGFTGGTGGLTASQKIETWTFASTGAPPTQVQTPVITPGSESFSGTVSVSITDATSGSSIFYTTDGSAPVPSAGTTKQYTSPLSFTSTTTLKAIATAPGDTNSATATATYTLTPTATPTISPAAGTYTSAQSVQLSDASPTPTIYYTTNGTTPTHSSTKYTAAIPVTSTTTITAIASSPGLGDSPAVSATFTINSSTPNINFASGFATSAGLQFNGSAALSNSQLELTNGGQTEAGSVFFTTPINIASFTTNFTFQLTSALADGFTFTIQNSAAGVTALGPSGGGLGYGPDAVGGTGGISNSVAVKFDLYSNNGEGTDSTGLYVNGASPTTPATDMTSSGVVLTSGDSMAVQITYNGTTLTMTITDSTVNKTFTTSWPVNIPQTIGGSTAFVGFTGGTGGETAIQNIKTWTFSTGSTSTRVQTPVITPGSESFSGTVPVSITDATSGSSIFYTTDGSAPVPGAGTTKQYTTALSFTSTTTLNAIATASGDANSATATATYTLQLQATATPVFSPTPGTILTTQAISISDATTGAAIHYTTNGSTPTSSSTLYSGPVTIATNTTFKAIAISTGFAQSAVATAAYTVTPTATPTISPAAGTYTSAQSVQLSDASPTPTIYYTTNGTTPTHSSTKYTAAIPVTSTTTITAIASSPGLGDSPAVSATFTINSSTPNINFASGFATSAGLQFNGSAALSNSQLELTNGGQTEAGSVFFTTPINIASFTTNFTFQLTSALADGFTFTIQNSAAGVTALGPSGGGLGYGPDAVGGTGGISNSVAVKFDLYSNNGEGTDSTGLYVNGASPTTPATDMTSSGVVLTSGDSMAVQITYNGTTLTMTITDSTVNKTFTTSWPVNIPQTIGGSTAFVGFTGGTGGETAIQNIKTWTFTSTAPPTANINFASGFASSAGLQFNGSAILSNSQLELTNGGQTESGSVFFTTPMNIASFTTNFTFQLTSAVADGFTFTIQNSSAGVTALGPTGGGLGYGPNAVGGTGGISNSVAVKFDLYSNNGEGTDSTGLYVNGASPTTPATDMTSSGVVLTSGDTMAVQITYNGTTLTMTITDSTVNKTFTASWPINIPQTIGGNTAFVGFTGGTGGFTAIQKIETWTFSSN